MIEPGLEGIANQDGIRNQSQAGVDEMRDEPVMNWETVFNACMGEMVVQDREQGRCIHESEPGMFAEEITGVAVDVFKYLSQHFFLLYTDRILMRKRDNEGSGSDPYQFAQGRNPVVGGDMFEDIQAGDDGDAPGLNREFGQASMDEGGGGIGWLNIEFNNGDFGQKRLQAVFPGSHIQDPDWRIHSLGKVLNPPGSFLKSEKAVGCHCQVLHNLIILPDKLAFVQFS